MQMNTSGNLTLFTLQNCDNITFDSIRSAFVPSDSVALAPRPPWGSNLQFQRLLMSLGLSVSPWRRIFVFYLVYISDNTAVNALVLTLLCTSVFISMG